MARKAAGGHTLEFLVWALVQEALVEVAIALGVGEDDVSNVPRAFAMLCGRALCVPAREARLHEQVCAARAPCGF